MKRIIILLLVALTCQAGRAISIDRFFKKYREVPGVNYQDIKDLRTNMVGVIPEGVDTVEISWQMDTIEGLNLATFQHWLNNMVGSEAMRPECKVGIRQIETAQAGAKTLKAMVHDLERLKLDSTYQHLFSTHGGDGDWHAYLKDMGNYCEIIMVVVCAGQVGLAEITGLRSSCIHSLLHQQKK